MRMIVAFEKTTQVRHIGHLDMQRAMQRALRRSGLPIKYSQGFNPHSILSFASPLPVGMGGEEELLDVGLESPVTEEEFFEKFSAALPASLPLKAVRAVEDQHPKLMASLKSAEYTAEMPMGEDAQKLADAIAPLLAKEEIVAIRKTKSGEKPCDIRPMLFELSSRQEGEQMIFSMRLSFTERETLKPDLLLKVLKEQAGVAEETVVFLRRTRLYGEAGGVCTPLMEC